MQAVLAKFESSDLCALVELQTQLANIRRTHELLEPHITLDSFQVTRRFCRFQKNAMKSIGSLSSKF